MAEPKHSAHHEGLSTWWGMRDADSLLARLGRYTRFVLYGKWSLLGVALLLVASLILWPLLTKDSSGLRVSFVDSKTAKQPPASPVMHNPEYSGSGTKGQQYKITGKTATQKKPTLITLTEVEATLSKPNGSWHILTAERAEYQQDKKLIDLYGKVTVLDGTKNTFSTAHATIDAATSHVYGTERITGEGNLGKLVASGFEIKDNGAHITFTRGDAPVTVTLQRAKQQR